MVKMLKNKQILALFISSFAVLFTGMGLFPILPLFAARFDANNSTTGFYLATIYAAYSLGPVVTGWLITHFSKKALFIIGGAVGMPALLGLGAAQNFMQVIVLTSLIWFSGGVVMALVSILTGLYTDADDQGKAFSLMAMVGPLGSLVGGATVGRLVAGHGYPVMFTVAAVLWSIVPLIGWLFLKEGPQGKAPKAQSAARKEPAVRVGKPLTPGKAFTRGKAFTPGKAFTRVLGLTFLGSMAVNVSRFGSSLSMQAQQFTPEAVSSVAMVSGLIAIPVTLFIGAHSDRLGRKHFLFASYLFAMSGTFILVSATALWQFSVASILHLLANSISGAMSQALTSEVVPDREVSQGLSWLNTFSAAASILCFAVGGLLYDLLGLPSVFLIAAALALGAGVGIETLVQTHRTAPALEDCPEA